MSLRSCSKNIEPFEGVIIGVRSFEKYKAHLGFNIKYDIKYKGCQNGYYKGSTWSYYRGGVPND